MLLCYTAANAQTAPTQASLLLAWEKAQKENPHTKIFARTKTPGVYKFETDLMPYNGRLKVLNAFISTHDYYGYDDSGAEADYIGIVEPELIDAPKDFVSKLPYSYAEWNMANRLHFADGSWLSQAEWTELKKRLTAPPPQCPMKTAGGMLHAVKGYLLSVLNVLIPLTLILLIFIPLLRRVNKKAIGNQTTMMDRQAALLGIAQENLALQKEQVRLLKELVERVKK